MQRYSADEIPVRDPRIIEGLAELTERLAGRYHRAEVRGTEHVPEGAALYVGNHSGGIYTVDTLIFAAAVYRAHGLTAVPYGLAHELVMELPLLREIARTLGAVRANHDNARRLLAAGHKTLVYPGGDVEAMRPFRHRHRLVFDGRRGYMRLAIATGVPVVPVVAAGSHSSFLILDDLRWLSRALGADRVLRFKVWPLTLSVPWGLTLGPPPPYLPLPVQVRMSILPPFVPERTGEEAAADPDYVTRCASEVERRMQAALTQLALRR
ncbi:MAG: 1-acyl-sn-glycerol-3-phosphate acyltransferase [Deltaproteobacteria bacterium]|nr:1-acyl-sn-glycerol-3-phosphate acyltransferase [Deltaproteobacteria bacterium]